MLISPVYLFIIFANERAQAKPARTLETGAAAESSEGAFAAAEVAESRAPRAREAPKALETPPQPEIQKAAVLPSPAVSKVIFVCPFFVFFVCRAIMCSCDICIFSLFIYLFYKGKEW